MKKYRRLYLWINIPIMLVMLILFISPFFIVSKNLYYIGISFRIITGIWCIFNGIWNVFTDYYSIFKTNRFRKINSVPKWGWWVVLVVGIAFLITAYMGYGFNNIQKPT